MSYGIESRLRALIDGIAPNQTARYDLLSDKTGVARHKWVNWLNDRQKLTLEMLDAYLQAWPEHALWVAAGQGTPPQGRTEPAKDVNLSRDNAGKAIANVHHTVSRREKGDPPNFEWGYQGTGPKELAMNILYSFGLDAADADYFARHFVDDILSRVPHEGGLITEQEIQSWIKRYQPKIDKHCHARKSIEALKQKQQEELECAMREFQQHQK